MKTMSRLLALVITAETVLLPLPVHAGRVQISVDSRIPASLGTRIDRAQNGVPLVNLSASTAGGV